MMSRVNHLYRRADLACQEYAEYKQRSDQDPTESARLAAAWAEAERAYDEAYAELEAQMEQDADMRSSRKDWQ